MCNVYFLQQNTETGIVECIKLNRMSRTSVVIVHSVMFYSPLIFLQALQASSIDPGAQQLSSLTYHGHLRFLFAQL